MYLEKTQADTGRIYKLHTPGTRLTRGFAVSCLLYMFDSWFLWVTFAR